MLTGYLILKLVLKRAVKITIISGKGAGQTRIVTFFDKTIKLDKPFDPEPDGTSKYKIWR